MEAVSRDFLLHFQQRSPRPDHSWRWQEAGMARHICWGMTDVSLVSLFGYLSRLVKKQTPLVSAWLLLLVALLPCYETQKKQNISIENATETLFEVANFTFISYTFERFEC